MKDKTLTDKMVDVTVTARRGCLEEVVSRLRQISPALTITDLARSGPEDDVYWTVSIRYPEGQCISVALRSALAELRARGLLYERGRT
ncbi:MAG: hypothetical protein HY369_05080 [Candidatus Aenigmarchaeota archaeon]|nr:hypothetical protein [Candidatus Aenigmarchaeota archaeon]